VVDSLLTRWSSVSPQFGETETLGLW
jgi:hypothetical protein